MKLTSMLGISLVFTSCFQGLIALGQSSSEDVLDAMAQAAMGPPKSVGEAISGMSPYDRQAALNSMVVQAWQNAAIKAEAEKRRQAALQVANQAAGNKSWQDAAEHADENKDKALRYNIELALKGDDYGEFRMGQRCRDGDAVPKNPEKARQWFVKAIAHGSASARSELARLFEDFPQLTNILPENPSANPPAQIR
jgi:TPR repeat protein